MINKRAFICKIKEMGMIDIGFLLLVVFSILFFINLFTHWIDGWYFISLMIGSGGLMMGGLIT